MAAGNLRQTVAAKATGNWVLTLAAKDASALAALRLAAGVEVGEASETLWIRSRQPTASTQDRLRKLPAIERYEWFDSERLCRLGSLIPCDRLPDLRWQPIDGWLKIEMPAAALPATPLTESSRSRAIQIRLVRSDRETVANGLLTTLNHWTQFGSQAPEIRLRGLQFAVNGAVEVLVIGEILPPLPGTCYCILEGIAVPAGLEFYPAVDAGVLRNRLAIAAESLVVFYQDGTFSRLQAEQWVAASRSAIRATVEAFKRQA